MNPYYSQLTNYIGVAVTGISSYCVMRIALTNQTALVAYEYFFTIDQEVNTVWKRKLTLSSVLLISIRWAMVLNQVPPWIPPFPKVFSIHLLVI